MTAPKNYAPRLVPEVTASAKITKEEQAFLAEITRRAQDGTGPISTFIDVRKAGPGTLERLFADRCRSDFARLHDVNARAQEFLSTVLSAHE